MLNEWQVLAGIALSFLTPSVLYYLVMKSQSVMRDTSHPLPRTLVHPARWE